MLVGGESEVGCWLHHSLVAGCLVWQHGLVHLLLGQVLALGAVVGVDRGAVMLLRLRVRLLLLLGRAVRVVHRRAVARRYLLHWLLNVRVLLEQRLVEHCPGEGARRWGGGAGVPLAVPPGVERDGLRGGHHPPVTPGGHHVAGHLLRRRALEEHVGRRVVVRVVHGVVAGVRGGGSSVTRSRLREAHLIELGVQGFRLRVQVIGWLWLAGALDWLLRAFPQLCAPASVRSDCSRVIHDSAAVGMNERLACVRVDQHAARRDP